MNQYASFGIRREAGDRATRSLDSDRELLASRSSKLVDFLERPPVNQAILFLVGPLFFLGLPQLRTRSVA